MSFTRWKRSTSDSPPPPPAPPPAPADRRRDRDRRERIATAVLAGLAANPANDGMPFVADIREAIDAADKLIEELDKQGGR